MKFRTTVNAPWKRAFYGYPWGLISCSSNNNNDNNNNDDDDNDDDYYYGGGGGGGDGDGDGDGEIFAMLGCKDLSPMGRFIE